MTATGTGRRGAGLLAAIGTLMLLAWSGWRWFAIAGGPWVAGHSCSSVVTCRDGLCLTHEREARGGALARLDDGYCSRRCERDADCPEAMACEKLPDGISRAAGDHLPLIKLPERLCVRFRGVKVRDGGR